ncbi:phosphoribosylformylglycinamidine synthase subunit PurS [Pseudothermotoga sp.]
MYRVRVQILPKEGVFDPQGQTVKGALEKLGFNGVKEVRLGKLIEIVLDAEDESQVKERTKAMCEKLLANPIIETYQLLDVEEVP